MDPDFVWKPALWVGSTLTRLPEPILTYTIPWVWNFKIHEVPLKDGATISKTWQAPVRINIEGQFALYDGSDIASDEEVHDGDIWLAVERFRAVLNSITADAPAEFFLFHDTASGTYRKFLGVHPAVFQVDPGEQGSQMWPYSLSLIATDPTIYTTAPDTEN